jgi:phosphatidate cytidylyltransferase
MSETETRGWPHGPTSFERRHGNATMRVVTGAVGIPIVLAAVWFGDWAFFLFMAAVIAGAMLELYWICEAKGARPHKGVGVVFGLLLAAAFFPPLSDALFGTATETSVLHGRAFILLGVMILSVLVTLVAEMRRDVHAPIVNGSTTLTGIFYVGLFLSTLIGIREFFTTTPASLLEHSGLGASAAVDAPNYGAYMVIATLVSIWICDSAAYYVGRAMGRHKMAPRISPKKTWEGGIGGAVFAVASMIGFKLWLLDVLTIGDAIALGLVVGVLGQIGDLAESQFKRDSGIKDSSQLIPGHGGLFDRFDSLMFVAPLVYLYLNLVVLAR